MASSSDDNLLTSRYASAWRQAAGKDTAKLAAEAAELQASLANDGRIMMMLDNPIISRRLLADALRKVAEKAGMSKITAQFLSVLANAGRQSLLPKILAEVQKQIDAANGVQNARLISAAPLNATAVKELQALLGQQLQSDVRLATAVDENLLGGVQIEMNSWLIDASLTGQLSRLERQLKSAKAA